jgi:energy-coupling factor transporter ATP-binding protein EcfA2
MANAYNVTLDPSLNDDLTEAADNLQISKEEAVKRALQLLKHASMAEDIVLTLPGGSKQAVRVK